MIIISLALATLFGEDAGSGGAPSDSQAAGWCWCFSGDSLKGWELVEEYEYAEHGAVEVREGCIWLEAGQPGTAIRWTGNFPKMDYEIAWEAMKTGGDDFFCGLTFPVGEQALTLIVGGWGGSVVGLSMVDGEPAVENQTCRYVDFELNRWYKMRLRVTKECIEFWLDDERLVHLLVADRRFSLRWESEPCLPLGIATWRTSAAFRDIRYRLLREGGGGP